MHTWSENPQKDMMQHLGLLTYENNCRKLLNGEISVNKKKLSPVELDKSSSEMAFCIKQGIEFFKNAESADFTISPLLIYYGMLSFAKALIISNSKEYVSLNDIKYHGLSTKSINLAQENHNKNKSNWSILNECANTNGGVFTELCKIFGITLTKNCTFELKETFRCIPELKNVLNKLKIIDSTVLRRCYNLNEENNKVSFAILSTEEDILKENFNDLEKIFFKNNIPGDPIIKYESKQNMSLKDLKNIYEYMSPVGGTYFVLRTKYVNNGAKDDVLLNQILLDYINFFILSDQVRYHQDNWNRILNGENDAIVSVLTIYVDAVKRKFPNLVLNELFKEKFTYGSRSYVG